jgi:hypothetical protein
VGEKLDPSSGLDSSVSAAKFVTVEKKEVQNKEEVQKCRRRRRRRRRIRRSHKQLD